VGLEQCGAAGGRSSSSSRQWMQAISPACMAPCLMHAHARTHACTGDASQEWRSYIHMARRCLRYSAALARCAMFLFCRCTWPGWSRDAFREWRSYIRMALPSCVMICEYGENCCRLTTPSAMLGSFMECSWLRLESCNHSTVTTAVVAGLKCL
jgi:hypothetical protein